MVCDGFECHTVGGAPADIFSSTAALDPFHRVTLMMIFDFVTFSLAEADEALAAYLVKNTMLPSVNKAEPLEPLPAMICQSHGHLKWTTQLTG